MSTKRSFKVFLPAVLWAILIVGLSSMPGASLPDMNLFEPDKLAHATVYALFTGLILRGFYLYNGKTKVKWVPQVLTAFIVAAGWGYLMELMQDRYFPGRMFEIADEIANIFGTILSIGIFKLLLKL
ncbi:MAG TPA: hypothetical protein ENK85_09100 [Saprospiraceae bacterium]|nr:hypothetical protein [Saprospiraceae bacterium]